MARRSYTDGERASALALIAEHGIAHAHRETGIAKSTLSDWAKKAGIRTSGAEQTAAAVEATKTLWEERRARMVHEIGEAAARALAQCLLELEGGKPRDAKDLATTMAILVDKAQLLSGGATSRPDRSEERDAALNEATRRARHLVAVG